MNSVSKRIQWIDIVKGIAILCMLWGHSSPASPFKDWIYSWHMPIFFVICGYLRGRDTSSITWENLIIFLKKRWHNLVIPYILFGVILIVFYDILHLLSHTTLEYLNNVWKLASLQGINSLWFLPVYFMAELLFVLMPKNRNAGILVLFLFIVLVVIEQTMLTYPLSFLYKVSEGFIFVFIGFALSKLHIENRIPFYFSIPLLILFFIGSMLNGDASMNKMNHVWLYFLNATGTSVGIITLINSLQHKYSFNSKFITYFGINSIIVLCTNNLIIEIIRLLDYKLTGNWMMNTGYLGCFAFFILLVIAEIPVIKAFEGRFGK